MIWPIDVCLFIAITSLTRISGPSSFRLASVTASFLLLEKTRANNIRSSLANDGANEEIALCATYRAGYRVALWNDRPERAHTLKRLEQ